MSEQRGLRKFLAARRLSWSTFWARRAPWRINLVKLFLVAAVLVIGYLAIPHEAQTWIQQALLTIVRTLAALLAFASVTPLIWAAALLAVVCLALIFVHPYHHPTYLATTPSAIPMISIYVDAENQLSKISTIPKFADKVVRHLNGRRADLLFFMDASSKEHGAQTDQFKTLCRYGFHPVHVAHNPTGKARKGIKEAVDKELAMHAYERALLGPPKQEFIIVTSDQDFVALVYRLAALGHHVQVWATPVLPAYRELQTYLDIELNDLALLVSESESSEQEDPEYQREAATEQADGIQPSGRDPQSDGYRIPSYEMAEPTLLSEAGEKQLYRAIVQTIRARDDCERERKGLQVFRATMGSELASRLAGVGYRGASKIDYWLDHLYATGALQKTRNAQLPGIGTTPPESAAHALFLVARLAAEAAVAMGQKRADGIASESDIADALLAQRAQSRSTVRRLLDLIEQTNKRRTTHARYLVRCAQALGLIVFDDVPNTTHLIRMPRLVETSDAEVSEASPDMDEAADEAADEAVDDTREGPTEYPEMVDGAVGIDVGNELPSTP
jgi:hypothetical protein